MDRIYVLVRSPENSVEIFEIDPENTPVLLASTNPKLILIKAHAKMRLVPLRELGVWTYYIFVYDNVSGELVGQVKIAQSTTLDALNFE